MKRSSGQDSGKTEAPEELQNAELRTVPQTSTRAPGKKEHKVIELPLASFVKESGNAPRVRDLLNDIFHQAVIGIAVVDLAGALVRVNPSFCRMLGFTSGELFRRSFRDLAHPDDQRHHATLFSRFALGRERQGHYVLRYLDKQARVVWLQLSISLVRDRSNEPLYFVVYAQDVTAFKRQQIGQNSEHEILELIAKGADLERVLDKLAAFTYDAISEIDTFFMIYDHEARRMRLSPSSTSRGGFVQSIYALFERDDIGITPKSPFFANRVVTPDLMRDPLWETTQDLRTEHGVHAYWAEPICSSRQEILGSMILLHRRSRTPTIEEIEWVAVAARLAGIAIDRKQAEESIQLQQEFLRQVIDINPNMIFAKDREGRFLLVNQAVANFYRLPVEQMLGRTIRELNSHPEQVQKFEDEDDLVLRQLCEKVILDSAVTDAGGHERRFQVIKRPILARDGSAQMILGVATDTTELKRAEEERLRFEKQMQNAVQLERLGLLAGGIAHDFNNLLMVIMGYSDLAKLELPPGDTGAREKLDRIQESARQARELIGQLLAYSGQGKREIQPISLSELVCETVAEYRPRLENHISLTERYGSRNAMVEGDAVQLKQLVTNILDNAVESIPEGGGQISIETGWGFLDEDSKRNLVAGEAIPPGDYLYFEVRDTGHGIDTKSLSRVFEPFFSTKFAGRGLGLAAVSGIVRNHHGGIELSSSLNCGTELRVYLPAVSDARRGN